MVDLSRCSSTRSGAPGGPPPESGGTAVLAAWPGALEGGGGETSPRRMRGRLWEEERCQCRVQEGKGVPTPGPALERRGAC